LTIIITDYSYTKYSVNCLFDQTLCDFICFYVDNFRRRDTMQQGMVNFQYDDVS